MTDLDLWQTASEADWHGSTSVSFVTDLDPYQSALKTDCHESTSADIPEMYRVLSQVEVSFLFQKIRQYERVIGKLFLHLKM